MLMMRLQRIGRKNDPSFRVVVTDKRNGPRAGNHVDTIGSYNPKMSNFQIDAEKAKHWLSQGVQPSDTVYNFLVTEGIIEGKKRNVLPKKSPIVSEKAEEEEKTDEPTETSEEAPEAEEVKEEAPVEEKKEETPVEEEKVEEEAKEEVKEETPAEEEKTDEPTVESPVEEALSEETEKAPTEEKDTEEESKETDKSTN